jgi:dihydrolipoamide dehydrogenase
MSQRVVIPRLGQTMTEGTIIKWCIEHDKQVAVGDILYELEYDKAITTVEAKKPGVLKQLVKEGETRPVGAVVGIILEPDEVLDEVINQNLFDISSSLEPTSIIEDSINDVNNSSSKEVAAKTTIVSRPDADVIIIGGGPAGYVCAIRLGMLGAKVILIEKDKIGGTCLNHGCIPMKVLLQSAALFTDCMAADAYGIKVDNVSFDLQAINIRKNNTVDTLVNGVNSLLNARKVEIIYGTASFIEPKSILVNLKEGKQKKLSATNIVIATGSIPEFPSITGINGIGIITSKKALEFEVLPKSMIILGGNYIGMELATIYSSFGCKTTILEASLEILPQIDYEIARYFHRLATKKMDIFTHASVTSITDTNSYKRVTYTTSEEMQEAEAEVVLCVSGRKPNIEDLNCKMIGINIRNGCIVVDDEWKTNITGIYCIGDANGENMLAHVASEQGIDVANCIMGQAIRKNNKHQIAPNCIYTDPEIGVVGKTEEQCKRDGIAYKVSKFNLRSNGRSLVLGKNDGFVKILASKEHNEILGVHIIGPYATEIIGECTLAMRMECCLEELVETIHAHPTVTEAIKEAAEKGLDCAIHGL